MNIRSVKNKDIDAICAIYNHYIENTVITFEETPVTFDQMSARVKSYLKDSPWLVCEIEGKVVAFAYASKWKEKSAYKNTLEITVYVDIDEAGKGYGNALYTQLISELSNTHHVLLACIALPNDSSIALHEKFGFEKVAHFKQVGRKFGRWVDVAYWQKTLS